MTVIACKDGLMVADKKWSHDKGGEDVSKSKIRTHKGIHLASTGNASHGAKMERWFMNGAIPEDFPQFWERYPDKELLVPESTLIVVKPNIGVFTYKGVEPEFIGMKMCAFGSGGHMAYGAMRFGATAQEAVDLACEKVENCGLGTNRRKY